MAKFMVRWGTYQGGPSLIILTGGRVRGWNLPTSLCAFLNVPFSANAIRWVDLGPDGHFILEYRTKKGGSACIKSPNLESYLGIPALSKTETCSFTWSDTSSAIVSVSDRISGQSRWYCRDPPQSLTNFMAKHSLAFDNNIHEFDLGAEGGWLLLTGTISGYDVEDGVKTKLLGDGNQLRPGFSLSKTSRSHFYLECPNPYIFGPVTWIEEISTIINDAPIRTLAEGYYDEKKKSVILANGQSGAKLVKKQGGGGGFGSVMGSPDVIASGLDVINTTLSLLQGN